MRFSNNCKQFQAQITGLQLDQIKMDSSLSEDPSNFYKSHNSINRYQTNAFEFDVEQKDKRIRVSIPVSHPTLKPTAPLLDDENPSTSQLHPPPHDSNISPDKENAPLPPIPEIESLPIPPFAHYTSLDPKRMTPITLPNTHPSQQIAELPIKECHSQSKIETKNSRPKKALVGTKHPELKKAQVTNKNPDIEKAQMSSPEMQYRKRSLIMLIINSIISAILLSLITATYVKQKYTNNMFEFDLTARLSCLYCRIFIIYSRFV
ncbi:unnamed protein product [Ambrosiozyma monospora]|uniref:Unnamed protein product n=1 Tax=Ambrosiozyma monospora TaxID=43982 RepID=A0ACB5T035_AMBMO|nr:unnamed protein product [Ambrosiozyma monospora]